MLMRRKCHAQTISPVNKGAAFEWALLRLFSGCAVRASSTSVRNPGVARRCSTSTEVEVCLLAKRALRIGRDHVHEDPARVSQTGSAIVMRHLRANDLMVAPAHLLMGTVSSFLTAGNNLLDRTGHIA